MAFLQGALHGSRNLLARRLENMYRDEREAIADDRWERTHALNSATTQSHLQTAEQARTFAAALQPHQLTAAALANRGTEHTIQQQAELHPHRVTGTALANALNTQTHQQRSEQHPLTMQRMRGQLTQQGLTTDRMRDENAFLQTYRPGLLEAQRIGNAAHKISLRYLPLQLQEQIRATQQATDQAADMHTWNLANAAVRYGLSQAQVNQINQMLPAEKQRLQATINLLNAQTTAAGQPQYKSPTFRAEYYDMAQARGRGFATKIDQLKKRKEWFAGSMSEYQILEMAKNEGREIRRTLGNTFLYTPDDIHRYASGFIQGMADPEVSEPYYKMLQRLGKDPKGISDLEVRIFNAFWHGIYGAPDPKLTPEQQKMMGEGVTDDGWFNWGNIAKYGGLGLGAMQALSYIPKLRWMRPTRWGSRAAIGTWRAGRLAPQKVQTGFRNLKIENMQITARQKVIDLQAKATYEAALGGSPNPATIRALDDAMAEAKRLGH